MFKDSEVDKSFFNATFAGNKGESVKNHFKKWGGLYLASIFWTRANL